MPSMDELFERICAAMPDPVVLTREELAMLEAYLHTRRHHVSYAALQRAARGDAAARAEIEAERVWRAHLPFVLEYNRSLLADEQVGAEKTSRGGRPKVSKAEAQKRNSILDAWEQAKAAGVRQKDFCADHHITVRTLHTYVSWRAQQQRRALSD